MFKFLCGVVVGACAYHYLKDRTTYENEGSKFKLRIDF